jgi:hypothetical protein
LFQSSLCIVALVPHDREGRQQLERAGIRRIQCGGGFIFPLRRIELASRLERAAAVAASIWAASLRLVCNPTNPIQPSGD